MNIQIIESSGRGEERRMQFASSLQILEWLQEQANKSNNLPGYKSISRLVELIKNEVIDQDDIPVKRLFEETDTFQKGRIEKEEFLIRILLYLEDYGTKTRDLQLTEELEELKQELHKQTDKLVEKINQPVVDFKEIPSGNKANEPDTFELFAGEFLHALGYIIEDGPSRGSDEGKDLIVVEPLSGIFTSQNRRWLVSCKHKAHSGKSVSDSEENNLYDRVSSKHKCDGIIAFYSTLPSSTLEKSFKALQNRQEDPKSVEIFHKARIERLFRANPSLDSVFARFFPNSYKEFQKRKIEINYEQENLINDYEYNLRRREAIRRNDAIKLKKAERNYEDKKALLQQQRDLHLKHLD